MSNGILWPTIALVALTAAVWATLFASRGRHIRRSPPRGDDFASADSARRYFQPVELPANNLANLTELPVLYYALVPLLVLTGLATPLQVGLAWAFVLLRALHSLIHIVVRNVLRRMIVYTAATAVLFAMWLIFAIDLLRLER